MTSDGKAELEGILCPKGPSILSTIEQFYGSVPENIKDELDTACTWSPEFESEFEALLLSEQPASQSYTQGGIDWLNICQTVQIAETSNCYP